MRLFVLARHAQSVLNLEERVNGDPAVDVPLTERGREQAWNLGLEVAHLPLDLCVTSRFPRARVTAELAMVGREVPVETEPLLDDIDVGELEGRTIEEYRAWRRARTRADRFPGGESLDEAAARYAQAFRRLVSSEHDCVLVVCHEIPLRYALNAAGGSSQLDGPVRNLENAVPYCFDEAALLRAADAIEHILALS